MANPSTFTFSLGAALLAYVLYTFGPLAHRTLTVVGALRLNPASTLGIEEVAVIPDTTHCEDLHYHPQSGTLFTACEGDAATRFKWFPPLANFDDPEAGKGARGSIHVIDPKTMKAQRLSFENFDDTFVTHGIDVIPDPENGEAVYIFAINHVPHPSLPKARSQVEIFHHVVGSPSVRHVRSVWHPLIRTPNDLFATSPTSFYVTNDHRYADHGIMRLVEDLYFNAKWTDTIHIKFDSRITKDSAAGVDAVVALDHIHNNNGLGHGRTPNEILIASCVSGVLNIGEISPNSANRNITLVDAVPVDAIVDNPGFFSDPFAKSSGIDQSGFILPGLSRAIDLAGNQRNPDATDPVVVWFAQPKPTGWQKRILFEDDGSRIRSASAAVLVAIDPATTGGARKAWLFVTGFMSKNMIAVRIDL